MATTLNICPEPQNSSEWRTALNTIPWAYEGLTEFNYGISVGGQANKLEILINETLSLSDPAEIVGAAYKLFSPTTCFKWQDGLIASDSSVQAEPFIYLTCAYFPMAYWSIGPGTMFPPMDIEDGANGETCKKQFNVTVPTMEELQHRYNYSPEHVLDSKRMLFTSNEYDPVSACEPTGLFSRHVADPDRNASRLVYVQNTAHTEESFSKVFAGNRTMRSTALMAQNEELQIIKGWLA